LWAFVEAMDGMHGLLLAPDFRAIAKRKQELSLSDLEILQPLNRSAKPSKICS
jgi:hypothetical protein